MGTETHYAALPTELRELDLVKSLVMRSFVLSVHIVTGGGIQW